MSNTLSDVMANRLASPPVSTAATLEHGVVYSSFARVAVLSAHLINHIYPMFRLPAHARVVAYGFGNDVDLGVATFQFGIWNSGNWLLGDQGAKTDNYFTSDQGFGTPPFTTESLFSVVDPFRPYLWQAAGDAVAPRPGATYDLAWQAQFDPGVTGSIATQVLYTVGV